MSLLISFSCIVFKDMHIYLVISHSCLRLYKSCCVTLVYDILFYISIMCVCIYKICSLKLFTLFFLLSITLYFVFNRSLTILYDCKS